MKEIDRIANRIEALKAEAAEKNFDRSEAVDMLKTDLETAKKEMVSAETYTEYCEAVNDYRKISNKLDMVRSQVNAPVISDTERATMLETVNNELDAMTEKTVRAYEKIYKQLATLLDEYDSELESFATVYHELNEPFDLEKDRLKNDFDNGLSREIKKLRNRNEMRRFREDCEKSSKAVEIEAKKREDECYKKFVEDETARIERLRAQRAKPFA